MANIFCDTNILIYAFAEVRDPRKQSIARSLLDELLKNGCGCLSAQVLSEFFVVSTVKMRPLLSKTEASKCLQTLSAMSILPVTGQLVDMAVQRSQASQISDWDALIVEAALAGGAEVLYSEDIQDGMMFGSVRVVNPFR